MKMSALRPFLSSWKDRLLGRAAGLLARANGKVFRVKSSVSFYRISIAETARLLSNERQSQSGRTEVVHPDPDA